MEFPQPLLEIATAEAAVAVARLLGFLAKELSFPPLLDELTVSTVGAAAATTQFVQFVPWFGGFFKTGFSSTFNAAGGTAVTSHSPLLEVAGPQEDGAVSVSVSPPKYEGALARAVPEQHEDDD